MTITGIITAIVFGAIIGGVARLIVPGKQNISIWLTVLVGIVAAFIGTWLANAFGFHTRGWNFWETIFQIVLAVIAVYLVAAFWPRAGTHR
ncbi:transglycosylase [Actinomadura vinacea]|uniref:Transglycosylase n=1 Tax=Actinomadura vinacea TaxID=115336 RepID=A0ABN3K8S5_9ACTN